MATSVDTFNVTDAKAEIGSIITSDKATLLSGRHGPQIRELLEERGVLVFPKVGFDTAEQIEFSKTIGAFAPEMRAQADISSCM